MAHTSLWQVVWVYWKFWKQWNQFLGQLVRKREQTHWCQLECRHNIPYSSVPLWDVLLVEDSHQDSANESIRGACCSFYSVIAEVLDASVSIAAWLSDEFSIARPGYGESESGKISEYWETLADSTCYTHISLFQHSVHTYSIPAERLMLAGVILRDTNQIHSTYCPDNSAML